MRQRLFSYLLFCSACLAQTVPSQLTATSATSLKVQLSWTSDNAQTTYYEIDRRTLTGPWAQVGASNAPLTTYTDTSIDGTQTYVYRVIAIGSGSKSNASNEITVGPPPDGFSVVQLAKGVSQSQFEHFGYGVRMALDANGDPAFVHEFVDPNGDQDYSDTQLLFVRWNRAQYRWSDPVLVSQHVGDTSVSNLEVPLALAFDASTGNWGVAYRSAVGGEHLDFALSADGGLTWKVQPVFAADAYSYPEPALALRSGTAYLAYGRADSIVFRTGSETADPATWTTLTTNGPGDYRADERAISLALDSAGKPAIGFWGIDPIGSAVFFWRPGSAPVKAIDNGKYGNDAPALSLAFNGLNPRLAYDGQRDEQFYAAYGHDLWVSQSLDGGSTWTAPVAIPSDGNRSMNGPLQLAVGPQGQSVIATYSNSGSLDNVVCGEPKLSRSNDFTTWTTCGPAPINQPAFSPQFDQVQFDPAGRLLVGFQNFAGNLDLPPGVILWHEPANPASALPVISAGGIVNAASYTAPIAPGSLASIFGTNFLSGAGAGATNTPLPTNLGGLEVLVNGTPAPLIYASQTQINFQMPYEVAAGPVKVVVSNQGTTSQAQSVTIAPAAPGILLFNGTRAVAQNQDYSVNDANNPAKVNSYVVAYMVGGGAVQTPVPTGAAATGVDVLKGKVTVTLGGNPVPNVLYAGLTPTYVGLIQINFQVPNLPTNTYDLVVSVDGVPSNKASFSVTQ